jgi:hypothetical protein
MLSKSTFISAFSSAIARFLSFFLEGDRGHLLVRAVGAVRRRSECGRGLERFHRAVEIAALAQRFAEQHVSLVVARVLLDVALERVGPAS